MVGQKAYLLIETAVGKTGEAAKFLERQTWLDSVENDRTIRYCCGRSRAGGVQDRRYGKRWNQGPGWNRVDGICPISIDNT